MANLFTYNEYGNFLVWWSAPGLVIFYVLTEFMHDDHTVDCLDCRCHACGTVRFMLLL